MNVLCLVDLSQVYQENDKLSFIVGIEDFFYYCGVLRFAGRLNKYIFKELYIRQFLYMQTYSIRVTVVVSLFFVI